MERSRKRFNSESHSAGNKRKSRKSKRQLSIQDEVVDENSIDSSMDPKDANSSFVNQLNDVTLIPICKDPYSEDDDKIIIKYFQENMHLLCSKEDVCIYHVLKSKYSFQKSAYSLQNRLLNVILPNLYKYNVINYPQMIDFYDAAKLELPEEFIKILYEQEVPNKKSKTTPEENNQTQCSTLENPCNNQKTTNKQSEIEISPILSASRQFNSQINEAASTSKEKCLKTILGFIQLNNSEGTSVFIPDTEPSVSLIQSKLLNDFGIRKESIKIIPKNRYDTLVELKDTFEKYDELVNDVLKNHIQDEKFIERMLPDARILFEYLEPFMEKSKRPLQRMNSNQCRKIILEARKQNADTSKTNDANSEFNTTWSEIEIDNVGQIMSTLSDSFDQVTISSNIENHHHQESNLLNENTIEMKKEPVDQDDAETIVRSPYFEDHSYCKINMNPSSTEATLANNNLVSVENTNNIMDFESNVIEHACTPQILFSKRCREKILKENINVDHLLRMRLPNFDNIPNINNCDENKSENSDANLI